MRLEGVRASDVVTEDTETILEVVTEDEEAIGEVGSGLLKTLRVGLRILAIEFCTAFLRLK